MSQDRLAMQRRMMSYASGAEALVDHDADRAMLQALADQDHRDALYVLGCVLDRDEKDPTAAQSAWLRSAQQGHGHAMYSLALQFWEAFDEDRHGRNRSKGAESIEALIDGAKPPDIDSVVRPAKLRPPARRAHAIYWFRQAGLIGHTDAAAVLAGILFRAGEQYRAAALPWYEKAAREGNVGAAKSLADMLFFGLGIARDQAAADPWYRKLLDFLQLKTREGEDDPGYDLVSLGEMYRLGQGTPRDVAQTLACWERAAAGGYAHAMCKLGDLYADGEDVPPDFEIAETWFQRAIAAGDRSYARFCLDDLPRKRLEAASKAVDALPIELLKQLVAANDLSVFSNPHADSPLTSILRIAAGTPFNLMSKVVVRLEALGESPSALALMAQSALAGNRATAVNLARRYELGWNGAPEDLVATMRWLRHAACLGEPMAMMRLAERLMLPEYGKPDPAQAYAWLMLASQTRFFATPIPDLIEVVQKQAETLAETLTSEQRAAAQAMFDACENEPSMHWPGGAAT